jgi:hypothetical protein
VNILDRFSKNPQITNFIKIRPVRADFFNAGGKTDVTELIAFHDFANAPKNASNEDGRARNFTQKEEAG